MSICAEEVFQKVFHRNQQDVQRYLISRGASLQECADIVQESFVRLWKQCKELSIESARPMLYTISSRILIDEFRKKQTRQKYQLSLDWKVESEDAHYQLEMEEFKDQLERAIISMPETAREVFMMHRFQDMKYKEIASALEISVKAVEKRMSKALAHLIKSNIPKFR